MNVALTRPIDAAPVVVFAYNRRAHLERTLASLRANPEAAATHLHVYCDAARSPAHQVAVDDVRSYVTALTGFASVTPVLRESNMGLAASVIDGVTRLLETHDRLIVLEDDLVLSPHFLRYMNEALALYRGDERVASVHGYVYPIDEPVPETFFLQGADCWGWGTWPRAWRHFERDGARLLAELRARGLCRDFDFEGQYPYTAMLEDQIAGRNSSWAIRWHAACYLQGMLTLYPGRSLVENIGNDSSGTHCGTSDAMGRGVAAEPVRVDTIPVEASAAARAAFARFFSSQRSWKQRVRSSLRSLLRLST